ncbi:MAG: TolC family protein [Acidobacteriota bacterium]
MKAVFIPLLILLITVPTQAQEPAPQRVGVSQTSRRLELREAIEKALAANLEIEIERTNTELARQAVKIAQAYTDTIFRWQPVLETLTVPTSSVLIGAEGRQSEHRFAQDFHVLQKLPNWGTQLSLDFENNRLSTNNPFVSLNPFFNTRLFFNLNQPMLRNFLIDPERAQLQIRRKQLNISETEFELRAIDIITRVEEAYWDLLAARQDVDVKADAVQWAREQLGRTQRMIDAGTLAPVELAAAEAELERRRDTWFASVGLLTEAENRLKALLAPNRQDELWQQEVIPVTEKTYEGPETEDLPQAVGLALDQRPELRVVRLRQEANTIQKQLERDQTKPQLDLVASYGNTGLGGTLLERENPFSSANVLLYGRLNQLSAAAGLPPLLPPSFGSVPEFLVGGYGTSLSNLFSGRFQTAQVGLSLDLNLRNRAAEARLAQTLVTEKQLKLEQDRIEQVVEAQLRNAIQAIQTARQRIAAAEASVKAAKEKFDSEIRLFQTGESTNFLVLTRQNEFSDSRLRQVIANLDYNKAVSRLEQALGSTFKTHQIILK